jgi:hypothetical protein
MLELYLTVLVTPRSTILLNACSMVLAVVGGLKNSTSRAGYLINWHGILLQVTVVCLLRLRTIERTEIARLRIEVMRLRLLLLWIRGWVEEVGQISLRSWQPTSIDFGTGRKGRRIKPAVGSGERDGGFQGPLFFPYSL